MNAKIAGKRILSLLICATLLITGVVIPSTTFASSGTTGGNLVLGKAGADVTATTYDPANVPQNTVDGCMGTKWLMESSATAGALTVNFGLPTQFSNLIISDYNNTVKTFSVEYYNGTIWAYAYKGGTTIGMNKLVTFTTAVTGTKIRLNITTLGGGGITELEVYNGGANKATVTVANTLLSGKSTKYVGFSSGNIKPGNNITGWIKYSNVNSLRVWNAITYVTEEDVSNDPDNILTVADLDARKAMLRTNPDTNTNINWDNIDAALEAINAKNTMAMHKRFGIEDLNSISCLARGTVTWQDLWDVWKKSYIAAFYFAKNYDAATFQSANEPGSFVPSDVSITDFVRNIQIQSDALRCAVADVNRIYGKNLVPTYVGPTLASALSGALGVEFMKKNRTDYHGNTVDYNIYDQFDWHKYSGTPDDYAVAINDANATLKQYTPDKQILPLSISEWNWKTGGSWSSGDTSNIYTSDSPNVFSVIGASLTTSMLAGIRGMYLFKNWATPPQYRSANYVAYTWGRDRDETTNLAKGKPTTVSSAQAGYGGEKVVDGDIRDDSAWITPTNSVPPQSLEIDLQGKYPIQFACIDMGKLNGNGAVSVPKDIALQYWDETTNNWISMVADSANSTNYLSADLATPVTTNKIRCISSDSGALRIRDINVSQKIPDDYIGGPMKSYEINRMFATGFKGGRDLYTTTTSDSSMKVATSYDPISNNYYMWFSQPNNVKDFYTTIDLKALDVYKGTQVEIREVSAQYFGGIPYIVPIDTLKSVKINIPRYSAILVTIPKGPQTMSAKDLFPTEETMVSIGSNVNKNYSNDTTGLWTIRQSTSVPSDNSLTYLKFNTGSIATSNIKTAILELRGRKVSTDLTTPFTLHAYGLDTDNWSAKTLTGNNAPNLNANCAFLKDGGVTAWPIGNISFMGATDFSRIDVTDYIKNHPNTNVTIAIERDKRMEWEVDDTTYVEISSSLDPDVNNRPKIKLSYTETVMPFTLSNLSCSTNADTVNISADIKNNTTSAKTVNVIYAVYKANKLVGIKINPQSFAVSESKSLTYPFSISQSTTWDTIKAFVFDTDLTVLKAIAGSAIFEKGV